jgi:hypothetical protein
MGGSIHSERLILNWIRKRYKLVDREQYDSAHDQLLEAASNLENDNGAIPDHAWLPLQKAIQKVKSLKNIP